MRRLAGHLAGCDEKPGVSSALIETQSALRITGVHRGSLVVEAGLGLREGQALLFVDHGQRALEALLDWDGREDSRLPGEAAAPLRDLQRRLPPHFRVFLGESTGSRRRIELEPIAPVRLARSAPQEAVLEGWLKEINWKEKTAQLHRGAGGHVVLRFDPVLDEKMRELANQYVEVIGTGRISKGDQWGRVVVREIRPVSPAEPFDLDAFLTDPNPRFFEPERRVTIDLTEDEWTSFRNAIREGREA